ncbi:MAG: YjhX family toxin [Pseudomonadota bacterium]
MNFSKRERRFLHVLAQGGAIRSARIVNYNALKVSCFTRDGHLRTDCLLKLFDRLEKRPFTKSVIGRPSPATRLGIRTVNPQCDDRYR